MQYITAQSAQVLGSFQLHCSLGTVMFRYRYQIPPKDGSSHHNSSGLVPMAYQCTHGWSSRVHAHPGRLLSTWKSQTSHRGSSKPGPGSTASTSSKKSHVSYNPLNWKSLLEQSRWKCASLLCCHGLQEYKLVCFKLRQQDSCAVTTEISSHLDHLWWGEAWAQQEPSRLGNLDMKWVLRTQQVGQQLLLAGCSLDVRSMQSIWRFQSLWPISARLHLKILHHTSQWPGWLNSAIRRCMLKQWRRANPTSLEPSQSPHVCGPTSAHTSHCSVAE